MDLATRTAREQLEERLSMLRDSPAYRNYEAVREWVLEIKRPIGVERDVSDYWEEELGTLDYLFDASPLVIHKLRHHTYTVTGIRAYDYRTGKSPAARRFAEKLAALKKVGREDLLVPEAPILGGFGHDIEGSLYNIDTLKYFEALIALERGGALSTFHPGDERCVAWEIGAGWGGFPFAFKTRFPNTTYVIVDLPELFLFSATYLMTAFPQARVVFHGRDDDDPERWLEADFVFVPHTALGELTLPRLDLAINMVSFQEMTEDQVRRYVQTAHALGARFLYSLNRERSHYNDQLTSVSAAIEECFWAREVPVLPVNYMKMLDGGSGKKERARDPNDYRHLVGTRRLEP